ncbi:hypothetical protein ACFQ93_36220, partial [Streptomyces sp. NPDC056601]|uniref:hypothetical protein n=1 Tax=Streptomyces sp. NPDC056601 TaxID=3345875 RepID=UPI0036B727D1
ASPSSGEAAAARHDLPHGVVELRRAQQVQGARGFSPDAGAASGTSRADAACVHPGEACASLVATARRMQRCREAPAPAGREGSSGAIESAVLNSSATGPALS